MAPKKKRNKMDAKDRVLSKFTLGRTKSIKKRKNTLLLEYKMMGKSNKFVDRRIGEKNRNMTSEDRLMARFVAHRMKSQNKKQMFNLNNDEEVLTHQGRTLQDIEKFDNPRSDSEDDEDGKLEAKFVENAHFGGGLFTKNTNNENTRQNTIDMLIAESKRRKAERQQTKDETQTLTEKLDNDLKELFPVVNNCKTSEPTQEPIKMKQTQESYDVLVRELKFEPVGKPSNKLKPEDEIVGEKNKKLEILERERLERMKRKIEVKNDDEATEPAAKKHMSADDLDDGFDLHNLGEDDDDEEEDEDENSDEDNKSQVDGDDDVSNDDDKTTGRIDNKGKNQKPSIVPETLIDLMQELEGKNNEEKIELIKNLITLQRIHTGVSVKENLNNFFNALLEYLDLLFACTRVEQDSWDFASKLFPILFELTQIGGDGAAELVSAMLKKKQQLYDSTGKSPVTADTLILLKLIPLLFPTSDYHHPIATPAMAFMCHILSQNSCKSIEWIAKGLFLSTVMLECVHLSGRYCPEVINFLRTVLYIAIPNFEDPHPPVSKKNKILVWNRKLLKTEISEEKLRLPFSLVTADTPQDDETIKCSILYTALRILFTYANKYNTFSASRAIWLPILGLLDRLSICQYPEVIQCELVKLQDRIKSISERSVQYLLAEKKRPKALRLYEPNIRPVIEGRSFRTVSQAKLEKEKLVHEYKREMKGALREIRKDKNFLARVKISEQAKKDAERKEKVKQIFNWGQNQQSELKQMGRKNRYRR